MYDIFYPSLIFSPSFPGVDADTVNKQEDRRKRLKRKQEFKDKLNKKIKPLESKPFDPKVVINSDPAAGGHRVKQIPFPFTSVPEFEAGMLANPIGRTFVPETAFRVLTKEKVATKKGTMIPPMAEDNIRNRRKGKEDKKNKKAKK